MGARRHWLLAIALLVLTMLFVPLVARFY